MLWRAPTAALAIVVGLSALTVSAVIVDQPVSIASVEGTGETSPSLDDTVTVEGVVIADLQAADSFGGVYLQSAEPSGFAHASDGIFVRTSDKVAVGDLINVTGIVSEVDGQTTITAEKSHIVDSNVDLPEPVLLSDTDAAREEYEGMLVSPVGDWVLESTDALSTSGSLTISNGQADATASFLTIDDGYSTAVVDVANRPYIPVTSVFSAGDAFTAPERAMVLGQSAEGYRLEPAQPVDGHTDEAFAPTFSLGTFILGEAPKAEQP